MAGLWHNMIMNDCVFCKIIKGEIPSDKIYEDDNFFAFLDINPVNFGHTLLIPKGHSENLYDLPDEILKKTAPLIKKIAIAVKKSVNADGINIVMNNDSAAGQVVTHAHFHIVPRFANDGFRHWRGKPYPNKESSAKVADKIRAVFIQS